MTAQQATVENQDPDEPEFGDELAPGTKLMHGQYTIMNFLNSGGFGITYMARDSLDRIVVIKECFPGNVCRRENSSVRPRSRAHQAELRSIVKMFSLEAQNLAKADHPNIVGVHNVFEYNNTAYMALDYVKGTDLLDTINEAPNSLNPDQIVRYLVNLLNAIGFIHGKGILHRDISPDNIIIDHNDEPVLIDFGAAREQATRKSRILSQLRVVKDGYSPQEFYVSGADQTESSDLYSLAASFYHVITGDLPPDSQKRLTAFASDDVDPYVPLAERTKDYSPAFCAALDKAMSVLPRDRVASAEEWLGILDGSLAIPSVSNQRPGSKVLPAETTNSKVPMLLGSTALVAVIGVGMFFTLGESEPADVVADAGAPAISAPAPALTPAPTPTPDVSVADTNGATPAPAAEAFTPDVLVATPSALSDTTPVERPAAIAFNDAAITAQTSDGLLSAAVSDVEFENRSEAPAPAAVPTPAEPVVAEPAQGGLSNPAAIASATSPQPLDLGLSDTTASAPTVTIDSEEISAVMSRWTPNVPFLLSTSEPGRIVAVNDQASSWMADGVRIISVDGSLIVDSSQISELLLASAVNPDGTVTVTVGTADPESGTVVERELSVPVSFTTVLLNGLAFQSRPDGDAWATTVTSVPEGSLFQVGDTVVAYMGTSEPINGSSTLADILEREIAAGQTAFSFALLRDEEMWIEGFEVSTEPSQF